VVALVHSSLFCHDPISYPPVSSPFAYASTTWIYISLSKENFKTDLLLRVLQELLGD